jgi:hypothetical protein
MGWVYAAPPEVQAVSQYRLMLAVCVSLTFVMVLIVCLRLFLWAHTSRLGAADYVMVVSMIFSIVYNALFIAREYQFLLQDMRSSGQKVDMDSDCHWHFDQRQTYPPTPKQVLL